MNVGSLVWVSNPEFKESYQDDLWLESTIEGKIDIPKSQTFAVKVRLFNKEVVINLKAGLTESDKLKPRCALINVSEADLLNIPELNEPEILSFLYKRFERGLIVTYTGTILLAMNPFEEVKAHNSSGRLIQDFASSILRETLDVRTTKVHAILISGESGSGKTEISKMVLKAFGSKRSKTAADEAASVKDPGAAAASKGDLLSKMMLANKVLESFGNARTATTANSSRFGKLVHLFFSTEGELTGCTINTYLLESSRILSQQAGERNYNIFYQLLAHNRDDERSKWFLKHCNEFHMTNQGNTHRSSAVMQDTKQFQELMKCLLELGFDEELLKQLWMVFSGILYLGQITFEELVDKNKYADRQQPERLRHAMANTEIAAKLLGLKQSDLEELMTKKLIASNKERITIDLNALQAVICRDALVKLIYKMSFDWVVQEMNRMLAPSSEDDLRRKIMLLDMFGFDSFQRNSIDQLCINYVNEALQQQFNEHIFRMEIKLYEEEGIKYEKIKFSDNKENVDLIVGIFRILDDQCRLPNPTDKRFAAQTYKEFDNNRMFLASKTQQRESKFTITHFAGVVEYTADDFIVKNIDNAPAPAAKILFESSNGALRAMFSAANEHGSGGGNAQGNNALSSSSQGGNNRMSMMFGKVFSSTASGSQSSAAAAKPVRQERTSLVVQIKTELNLLLRQIEQAAPHYIRCIKPFDKHGAAEPNPSASMINIRKKANSLMQSKVRFNQFKVAQQLHYGGVFEAVRVARSGFRSRMSFQEFYQRYRFMARNLDDAYDDPLILPHECSVEHAKRLCTNLIRVLNFKTQSSNSGNSGAAVVSASPNKKKLAQHSKATAGDAQDAQLLDEQVKYGLIDASQLQLGALRVFLRKKEYDVMEAFRNRSLGTCIVQIQAVARGFSKSHRFRLMRTNVLTVQRCTRGYLGRKLAKMQRILLVSVVTLQRKFRKKRFFRGIIKLQAIVRRLRAVRMVKILEERRAKLLAAYGVLMSSRELRMHRRRLQAAKKSNAQVISLLKKKHLHIPPPEIRWEERNYEDDNLVESIQKVMTSYEASKNEDNLIKFSLDEIKTQLYDDALHLQGGNDALKKRLLKLTKLLKAPEQLLKHDLIAPNVSMMGRLFGAQSTTQTITISATSASEVHIHAHHPIFSEMMYVVYKICKVEALLIKDIALLSEKFHTQLRNENGDEINLEDPESYVHIDPHVVEARKLYKAHIDIQENCSYLRRHYEMFIASFVREYGDTSPFCKSIPARTVYVKALLGKILDIRNQSPEEWSRIDKEKTRKLAVCPLVVEWDEVREQQEKAALLLRRQQLIEEANIQDSEILSKLAVADRRREEISTDNLRIIEVKGVGYQFQPYQPGVTYALNTFLELVSGSFLAGRRLHKVEGTRNLAGKTACYEACVGLTSSSFMDVLYNPVNIEQLDSVSFTAALMTCCVMGLYNLQPNHVLVAYSTDSGVSSNKAAQLNSIRIAGFNNDDALCATFMDYENKARARVHAENLNMLFLLPQMDEPVDSDVRAFLVAHAYRSEEIVSHWLRDLYDLNQRVEDLKNGVSGDKGSAFREDELKRMSLPIMLMRGCTAEVNKRLKHICKLLGEEVDEATALTAAQPANTTSATTTAVRGARSSSQSTAPHNAPSQQPTPNYKHVLHRDILHDFSTQLSEYYAQERSAEFQAGIEGVSGVVSYAHIYHECLEAEKRVVKAQRLRIEQLQHFANTATATVAAHQQQQHLQNDAAQPSKKKRLLAGLLGDKKAGTSGDAGEGERDSFAVDDDGYVEKRDDEFMGINPVFFKDVKADLGMGKKKTHQTVATHERTATVTEREKPTDEDDPYAMYGAKDEFSLASSSIAVIATGEREGENRDAPRSRKSFFEGRSPLRERTENDESLSDNAAGGESERDAESKSSIGSSTGVLSRENFLSAGESPLRARPGTAGGPGTPRNANQALHTPRRGSNASTTSTGDEPALSDGVAESSTTSFNNALRLGGSRSVTPAAGAAGAKKKTIDLGTRIRQAQKESAAFVKAAHHEAGDAQGFDYGALYGEEASDTLLSSLNTPGNNNANTNNNNASSTAVDANKNSLGNANNVANAAATTKADTLVNDIDQAKLALQQQQSGDAEHVLKEEEAVKFNTTVEQEAMAFLKNINFKTIRAQMTEKETKKFCSVLGKNLSFLSSFWLVNIDELQLKFLFKYWLNIAVNKKFEPPKIKLQVREVYLHYADGDPRAFVNPQTSALLYQLKFHLKMSIKMVYLTQDGAGGGRSSLGRRSLLSPFRRGNNHHHNGVDFFSDNFATLSLSEKEKEKMVNPLMLDEEGKLLFTFKEYNLSEFDHARKLASAADDSLDSDEEVAPSDLALKERLQKVLFSCSNLMTSRDFKDAKVKVELVKRVIHHVCSTENDYIDGRTVKQFSQILLDYPGLAKIGEVLAERKAFTKDKHIIHRILEHSLVERFTDLLMALLRNHPDLLWRSDLDRGLLPCDIIKQLPESKPFKYKLLCKFINFAGSQPSASNGSILSTFRGEEELIVRAAQHGLLATETELKARKFDMLKKCPSPFVPSSNGRQGQGQLSSLGSVGNVKDEALLWRLFVEEINGDERMRNRAWETYQLVCRCMKQRIAADTESATPGTNMEMLMWKSLDLEGKSADKCVIYHVSVRTLERSRILQDLKDNWMPGTRDKIDNVPWRPSLVINTETSRKRFGQSSRAVSAAPAAVAKPSLRVNISAAPPAATAVNSIHIKPIVVSPSNAAALRRRMNGGATGTPTSAAASAAIAASPPSAVANRIMAATSAHADSPRNAVSSALKKSSLASPRAAQYSVNNANTNTPSDGSRTPRKTVRIAENHKGQE